jgi:DNA-binding SARP family transcriptional activator/tetratricopeptide (TPR) repeat protein
MLTPIVNAVPGLRRRHRITMPVMGWDRADAPLMMGLLGPVEIGPAGGAMAPVPQPRLRVLLGLLGVAAGRVVSAQVLVDGVWGEEWSPRREQNLHTLVYQLRRRLAAVEPGDGPGRGGSRLARAGGGYRLALGPGELDIAVFTRLAGRGLEAARAGDTAAAQELFGQALGLWRGAALADVAPLCPVLAGEAARLEEQRLAVVEQRIECDLELGRHAEVAGELAALAGEFPLRERVACLLMTALYRCGRRGEALEVFDRTRRVLATELGLDPGPELAGLQAKVLADDPALAAQAPVARALVPDGTGPAVAAEGRVVPRQLPAGVGCFAGREAELKELDALLDQAGPGGEDGPGGAVVISAVAGMAGVGKTALAVHWARRVAGRFPDGQLYVNLRGYDAEGAAVTPEEVAGWFLVALGVPTAQIPADGQARYGLYRSVLAGRRVLIVLDNARDAAQVRPLLPGSPGCMVVVTSRSSLAGLAAAEGARPLRLGPLSGDEAVQLLAARLGPERVAAEPQAAGELVARCGHLPLALAVMAARAAADRGLPLGMLAGQLARVADASGTEPGRLDVLETGDAATSLRQLLSWSYRQLTRPAAAMLAVLGVHCGPDITVPAAASLAGVPVAAARRAMAELADASLLAEHRPGRYVMHDLVRGFAAGQARQDLGEAGIRAAVERSFDHYLHTMIVWTSAVGRFTPPLPAPGVVPEHLADGADLDDWAQAEHQVLLRATAQAAAAGFITHAWQIFVSQAFSLAGAGWFWADFRAVGQALLAASRAADDHAGLGWTHAILGWYSIFADTHEEDRAHLRQALDHLQQAGDLRGQALAHLFAARPAGADGDLDQAVWHCEQALALLRPVGSRAAERWALTALGECLAHRGDYDMARRYIGQALEAGPEPGDPMSLSRAWSALGLVHSRIGEHQQAINCYRQALTLVRQRNGPQALLWQADLLTNFGDACRAAGDQPGAVEYWEQARQILHDLRLPDNLGVRGRLQQAGTPSQQS